MKAFLDKNKYLLILLLLFLISEILVQPTGQFPLNDDWAYTKSVQILSNEGRIDIGEWPAMTLATHIVWGSLFVKIFGFSFFILRLSTILSAAAGLYFVYKLVTHISLNKKAGFAAALILLFNPIHFNLSNTFMTDVNFNTLLILCIYTSALFFDTGKPVYMAAVLLLSLALVMLRQFGLLVPVCFTLSCFFIQEKRPLFITVSAAGTILIYFIFKYYENYLSTILSPDSSYKFSADLGVSDTQLHQRILNNLALRWRSILLHVSMYTLPFTVMFLVPLAKQFKKGIFRAVITGAAIITVIFFQKEPPLQGNIFTNMSLGAETFYESLTEPQNLSAHTFSPIFNLLMETVKYTSVTVFLIVVISIFLKAVEEKRYINRFYPLLVMVVTFFMSYTAVLLITESYFDRYHLPIVTSAIVLFAFAATQHGLSWRSPVIPLLLFAYISIAGTRDYHTLNRTKWEAYHYLVKEKSIQKEKINAGFEVNCWRDGEPGWWTNILTLAPYDYLVQYRREPGFTLMKEYPFQRYLPYKKDKINIFVREQSKEL